MKKHKVDSLESSKTIIHKLILITFYISHSMLEHLVFMVIYLGFPGGSDGKASARNEGDLGSIPGSGRSPGEGNGNPLQYSCLENSMDRGTL